MEAYSIGKAVGVLTGIIIGLIICLIAFRYMNRDKKLVTKYDERQLAARGRAYMYGFWAGMIATAIVMILDCAGIALANRFTTLFFIIFVGIIVQVGYSIWNDAYYGINTNKKRFMIVCVLAAIANIIGVVGAVRGGTLIEDNMLSDSGTNLLCVILFAVIGAELFIKDRIDAGRANEAESEE